MDQQGQGQSQGSGQLPYLQNEEEQMIGNPSQGSALTSSPASLPMAQTTGAQLSGQLFSYQQVQERREKDLRQMLRNFWAYQNQDIKKLTDFKYHSLPLARIKKIMKADKDVKMISAEAPIVFAKACEMFILELTLRSWHNAEENKRRTLRKSDVTAAIARTDIFDFLVDVIPKKEMKGEPLFSMPQNLVPTAAVANPQTYYLMPPQHSAHLGIPTGLNMNMPLADPNLFRSHIPYLAPDVWYSQAQQQQQEEEEEQQQQPPQSFSDS